METAELIEREAEPPIELDGVQEARKHLVQAANLYNLCIRCVDKLIAPNVPEIARTSEMFQAAVSDLFNEATRWSFVEKMPEVPLKK